jgi:siroheme synthase-like protein
VVGAPVYPVALVIEGRACLVVGAGAVAARKVAGLVACGAEVTVIAPVVGSGVAALASPSGSTGPGTVRVERRPYRAGDAARFRLVVTATGIAAVDRAVARDAELAGVWVNTADDPEGCSFLLPAVHREGPVAIAVSTGGASPALAAWLRDRVAVVVGPETSTLAELLSGVRRDLRAVGRSTEGVDWRRVLDGGILSLVRDGHIGRATATLRRSAGLDGHTGGTRGDTGRHPAGAGPRRSTGPRRQPAVPSPASPPSQA